MGETTRSIADLMTEQQLADLAAEHHPEPIACYWRGAGHHGQPPDFRHSHSDECAACSTDDREVAWPCDVARLLEHIQTMRA